MVVVNVVVIVVVVIAFNETIISTSYVVLQVSTFARLRKREYTLSRCMYICILNMIHRYLKYSIDLSNVMRHLFEKKRKKNRILVLLLLNSSMFVRVCVCEP